MDNYVNMFSQAVWPTTIHISFPAILILPLAHSCCETYGCSSSTCASAAPMKPDSHADAKIWACQASGGSGWPRQKSWCHWEISSSALTGFDYCSLHFKTSSSQVLQLKNLKILIPFLILPFQLSSSLFLKYLCNSKAAL